MRRYTARPCIRQRIWRAMRIFHKGFTVAQLQAAVEGATYGNVQSFVSRLCRAGYLRRIGTVRRGYPGEGQGYILVRDTGPTMPVLGLGRHRTQEVRHDTDRPDEAAQREV